MTYVLDDLADYLQTQGVGTVGTDIFKSGFFDGGTPAAPDAEVALYEYQGQAPLHVLGGTPNPSPVIKPQVQIVTRDTKYSTARAKAQAVYNALAPLTNVTINGTVYLRIEALSEPAFIGSDQNSRPLIATNYLIHRVP